MQLLEWLNRLLGEPRCQALPLSSRVESLAASWQVEPAIAWHLVQTYAQQRLISLEAAVDALQGLSYDEARERVGEG